jgi:hypothetical protein
LLTHGSSQTIQLGLDVTDALQLNLEIVRQPGGVRCESVDLYGVP